MSFSGRRQFLRQPPWITLLFQLMHDVIGNSVAFFFGQFLAKSAHKFRPKRKQGIADLIGGKPDGNEHPFRPIGLGPRSK
jgi:hypothetical protein